MELVYALQTSQLAAINASNSVATSSSSSSPSSPLTLPPLSVSWLVSHPHLGSSFLDHMASAFVMPRLFPEKDPVQMMRREEERKLTEEQLFTEEEKIVGIKHGQHASTKFVAAKGSASSAAVSSGSSAAASSSASSVGPALGPQWLNQLHLDTNVPKHVLERSNNAAKLSSSSSSSSIELNLELNCEVTELQQLPLASPDAYPLALVLSNGHRIECDLVVSATGVQPNTEWCPAELTRSEDGGIIVDECLRTSVPDVFAAGDCATLRFSAAHDAEQHTASHPNLFHSSRLWSHAKLLGCYAARAMSGLYDSELTDLGGFNFLLFAHTTMLFGRKAIFLGRYNLQGYSVEDVRELKKSGALKTLVRCKPEDCEEFIKLHLLHHRIIGAVLLGGDETADLEETFENLALNQTNLEQFGDFLNDVDVDLADYFD